MTHRNRRIQIFISDSAKVYNSQPLKDYYGSYGIKYATTLPHTPEENSIAERINHTIFERARAALHASRLSKKIWGFAVLGVVDKHNKTLHSATKAIPNP